jgi:hypothetical protein
VAAQWEYKATIIADFSELNLHLNQMAGEGWELVSGNLAMADYYSGGSASRLHWNYAQYWRRPAS